MLERVRQGKEIRIGGYSDQSENNCRVYSTGFVGERDRSHWLFSLVKKRKRREVEVTKSKQRSLEGTCTGRNHISSASWAGNSSSTCNFY